MKYFNEFRALYLPFLYNKDFINYFTQLHLFAIV